MVTMLSREELLNKYGQKAWISPYARIICMVDRQRKLIELHEFHARGTCIGGSAWEIYHYPRVSKLVLRARREGARNIFIMSEGICDLKLKASIAGAGVEKIENKGSRTFVTYAGLAGGGIAATVCRGMAEGVIGVRIYKTGGGSQLGRATLVLPALSKVIIGVDDTDEAGAGATWGLVNEISHALASQSYGFYLNHAIVQFYTKNPHKTTNCVGLAVTFAVPRGREKRLIDAFKERVKRNTFSKHTGMVAFRGIIPPKEVIEFGKRAKTELLTAEEAIKLADKNHIETYVITGERGLIGALAAIGFANDPDEAVKIWENI
ncbi:MAG: methanogenesis marker protein 11 [Candidatus Bathyarchaeota archaeon]